MLLVAFTVFGSSYLSFVQVFGTDQMGSGVRVSVSHVITNHHVIKHQKQLTVVCGSTPIRAYEVAVDESEDLALLELRDPTKCHESIAVFPPAGSRGGAILTSMGCPDGDCGRMSFGIALQADPKAKKSELATTIQLHPGSSGSPAYDQHGKMVGIARASSRYGRGEFDTFGFLVSARYVTKFILRTCSNRYGNPMELQIGSKKLRRYCRVSAPNPIIPKALAR